MSRWFAMSTRFLSDPKVERMVDRHGGDAVAISVALLAQAMTQEKGGRVERTFRTLANEAFVDKETAEAIVRTADEVGFLVLEESNDFEFIVFFPAWERHQAAGRQAKSRAKKKRSNAPEVTDGDEDVTDGHGESPTRQDKTEQDNTETDDARDARAAATAIPISPYAPIVQRLDAVAVSRSQPSPAVDAALALCAEYGHRDLAAAVEDFAHYWTEGPGAKKSCNDVVWRFRLWLKRDDAQPPPRFASARDTVSDDVRRLQAEAERLRALEANG